jgi:hypothetical protein
MEERSATQLSRNKRQIKTLAAGRMCLMPVFAHNIEKTTALSRRPAIGAH